MQNRSAQEVHPLDTKKIFSFSAGFLLRFSSLEKKKIKKKEGKFWRKKEMTERYKYINKNNFKDF